MSYFNGLFSDTDPEFVEFNAFALSRITDAASGEKGVSRSAADKIIDSISDELLTDSRRLMYGRSYAILLGALRKHLKNDCVSMGPSERFDNIVSIFSEGSLRRFSDYPDADISIMTIHSAKGLEWDTVFIPGVTRFDWPVAICSLGAKELVYARVLRVDAESWMRRKRQTGLLRKWACCTSVSLAPAKRYMSPRLCSAGQITGTIRLPAPLV